MAVTITAAQLAEAVGVDSTTAARLLAVAAALVERYAPDAPDAVANEAVIRTAGWLAEQPSAAIRSETEGAGLFSLSRARARNTIKRKWFLGWGEAGALLCRSCWPRTRLGETYRSRAAPGRVHGHR